MSIHPKVAFAALATALVTAVAGVLAALGIHIDPTLIAGVTAIIGAVAGYLAPGDQLQAPAGVAQDVVDVTPVAQAAVTVAVAAGVAPNRIQAAVAPVQEAADIVSGVLSVVATFAGSKAASPVAPVQPAPAPVGQEVPAS